MKKEEIIIVAQLLTGIKDSINKLERAYKQKDLEEINKAKSEILDLQLQIDKIL